MQLIEDVVNLVIGYAVPAIELAGALVVVIGVVRMLWSYVRLGFTDATPHVAGLRLQLGQALIMGLEFQVASDILRTAIAPTWDDILQLGALILMRALLSYFLERELGACYSEIDGIKE